MEFAALAGQEVGNPKVGSPCALGVPGSRTVYTRKGNREKGQTKASMLLFEPNVASPTCSP